LVKSFTNKTFLIVLHVLVGLNAFAGGIYGLAGADNVPLEWLAGSPFHDYFNPSLILLVGVGSTQLLAALALAKKFHSARSIAAFAGFILLVWIIAQVCIIGFVSALQPLLAIAALIQLFASLAK
jgi:hypothetical protein